MKKPTSRMTDLPDSRLILHIDASCFTFSTSISSPSVPLFHSDDKQLRFEPGKVSVTMVSNFVISSRQICI